MDSDIIFVFLPEKFTLTELQNVRETVTDISVLPANFRRKAAFPEVLISVDAACCAGVTPKT